MSALLAGAAGHLLSGGVYAGNVEVSVPRRKDAPRRLNASLQLSSRRSVKHRKERLADGHQASQGCQRISRHSPQIELLKRLVGLVEHPERFGEVRIELLQTPKLRRQILRKAHSVQSTEERPHVQSTCLQLRPEPRRRSQPLLRSAMPQRSSHARHVADIPPPQQADAAVTSGALAQPIENTRGWRRSTWIWQRLHPFVFPTRSYTHLRSGAPPYDVLLCDVVMPGMNGLELHDRVRSLAPRLAEATVLMTGGAFTSRAATALAGSVLPRLDKPFSPEQLLAAVSLRPSAALVG